MKFEFQPCPWCRDTLPLEVVHEECSCKQHDWVFVECERCGSRGPCVLLDNNAAQEDIDKAELAAVNWFNAYVQGDGDDRK